MSNLTSGYELKYAGQVNCVTGVSTIVNTGGSVTSPSMLVNKDLIICSAAGTDRTVIPINDVVFATGFSLLSGATQDVNYMVLRKNTNF